jgi:hypothetical protein
MARFKRIVGIIADTEVPGNRYQLNQPDPELDGLADEVRRKATWTTFLSVECETNKDANLLASGMRNRGLTAKVRGASVFISAKPYQSKKHEKGDA